MAPRPPGNLVRRASGWYDSVRGRIAVSWALSDASFALNVSIPANCVATIRLPFADQARTIEESGRRRADGAAAGAQIVGSGTYAFVVRRTGGA